MGKLVKLQRGLWVKTSSGDWEFRSDPSDLGFGAMLRENETFESLMTIARTQYLLEATTPVVLTYQFPHCMLAPNGMFPAPIDILSTSDVFLFMEVRLCYPKLTIYVTVGAETVASYQFQCRTTFMIGGTSYLPGGSSAIAEEQRPTLRGEKLLIFQILLLIKRE